MKPATAALKLGVHLPATPAEFQDGMISREELDELQHNPPQWLVELRRNGPHPRNVVAARLRVSNSGLARGGVTEPLTSEQIAALAADPPEWLVRERETLADTKREEQRLAGKRESDAAEKAAAAAGKKPVRKAPAKKAPAKKISKRRAR
ncbi:hypothetical protein Val02_06960 [Virgisporangium aliadipatigenens]|uniref:Uncharacterized protein n=2 Tax=Virgisporangium aliadipatigenens TaxID=741659 RepID=A0A8J4DMH9_9ACTN|nr:hypothetical protein Val02_06960 [Virgisporangium aliadipatigenens]